MSERDPRTAAPAGQLLRLTVRSGERRVDVGLPGGVPLADILPAVARRLRVLDAIDAHAGYRFVRSDGTTLDGDRSLVAQSVTDGEVLVLEAGAEDRPAKTYDDVVEAVADVVEERAAPWTPNDTVTTTTVAAAVLLTLALLPVLLAEATAHSLIAPIGTGLAAIVLLVCAGVLERIGTPPQAPVALMFVASAHAAAAGFTATGLPPGWGAPTALAGFGAALAGAAGLLLVTRPREYSIIPLVVGLVMLGVGGVVWLTGAEPAGVIAIAMALTGIAGLGVPWLALASTPLRVVPARDDSEVYAAPEHISHAEVAERFARGHRVQVALRIAMGAIAIIATVPLVASGPLGLALTALTFLGMLLGVRQVYSRADIVTVATASIVGAILTIVTTVAAFPAWGTAVIIVLAAIAAVIVGLGLLAPKHRLWLQRLADPAEIVTMALLPPLAILVGGWF